MNSVKNRFSVFLLVAMLGFAGGSVRFEDPARQFVHMQLFDVAFANGLPEIIFADSFEDPAISVDSPGNGVTSCSADFILAGHVSSDVEQLFIDGVLTALDGLQFSAPFMLQEDGLKVIELEAVLTGGGSFFLQFNYTLIPPPNAVNTNLVAVSLPDAGTSTVTGFSLAADANASVTVTNTRTGGFVEVTADGDGAFSAIIASQPDDELSLVAEKGSDCPPADPVSVIVPHTNDAPTLNAIGDQVVNLGQSLSFTVSGNDTDGDPLSFMAFPLPANASLDGASGEFSFTPNEGQVSVFDVEFSVSDGIESDSETISITVNGAPAEGITMLSGRVIDTTDFVNNDTETPVVGAEVSILNSGISTMTGADGSFTLSPIPAGDQIFDINPAGVMAPDSSDYAGFREAIHIIDKVDNQVARPFFLPRIDMGSITMVIPNATTVVENTTLGVRIEIPPHTAKWIDGLDYAGPISISEVPDAVAPAALPPELGFGLLVTIQPVGVYFITPVPIFFPNGDGLPEGSIVDIWSLDGGTGMFTVVGQGEVINNEIVTVSGGVVSADWHGPMCRGADAAPRNSNVCDDCQKAKVQAGSETAVNDGSLVIRHDLIPYQSVGQWRAPSLVYNSANADPWLVLTTTATSPGCRPIKQAVTILSQGVTSANEVVYDTSAVSGTDSVEMAGQFDASMLPTGVHDYSLDITSTFANSKIITRHAGTTIVNNLASSSIGAGWGIAGINRLIEQPDQSVLMVDGDGSARIYSPMLEGSGKFSGPIVKTIGVWTGGKPIIADLNKDTRPDIIIPTTGNPTLGPVRLDIFLNDGSGDFSYSQFTTRQNPKSIAIADFNEDTNLDVVVLGGGGGDIHLGDGTGGFGVPTEIANTVSTARSVVVADFNKDTNLDIAYLNNHGALSLLNISIQLGDGAGGFSAQINMETDRGNVRDIISDDFNNDGNPDIAVAADPSTTGWVAVFLGDGMGGFADPIELPAGGRPGKLNSGDFNLDGNTDLLVAVGGAVSVIYGNGDGSFAAAETTALTGFAACVTAGDFDGNGNPDFAVGTNTQNNSVTLFDGNGMGGFPVRRILDVGFDPACVVAADFNNDALDDLLVMHGLTSRTVSIHLSDGPNNLAEVLTVPQLVQPLAGGMVIADFNEDGLLDAAVAKSGAVELYPGDGEDFALPTITLVTGQVANEIVKADFNADGHIDLAFLYTRFGDQGVVVRLGDGQGGFDTSVVTLFPDNEIIGGETNLAAGDINQDGLPDLVFSNTAPGFQDQIRPLLGDGTGAFNVLAPIDVANKPAELKIVDITGDGLGEIVSYSIAVVMVVNAYDGAGGFNEIGVSPLGPSAGSFDAGDVNGDGIVDIVIGNGTSGFAGGRIVVGIGDGAGLFANIGKTDVCIANDGIRSEVKSVTLIDLDNDGDLDAAFTCSHNRTLGTALNDGNGVFTNQAHLMTDGHHALGVGDFNRDGAVDLVSVSDVGLDVFHNIPTGNRIGLRSPGSDFSVLVTNMDGSYTRRLNDGTLIEFDTDGLQTSVTDRNGNTTSYEYDGLDRLTKITDPVGLETIFTYSGDHLSSITDPTGRITQFGHDVRGNLMSITDPDLSVLQYVYDDRHHLTKQTSKRGFDTHYDYDKYGVNWRTVRADNSAVLLKPSATAALPEPGSSTGTAVNPMPAVLAEDVFAKFTDGRGNLTKFKTNRFGSVTEMTDPLGRTTQMVRDGNNRVVHEIGPNGRADSSTYDKDGNETSRVLAQGATEEQQVKLIYEPEFNQPVQMADPAGKTISMEYDTNGNLTRLEDQLLGERLFTYNANGQPLTATDPNAKMTVFTYDAMGNVDSVTDPAGNIKKIQRDDAGRITQVTEGFGSPAETSITLIYDELSRVLSIQDATGVSKEMRYDEKGNVIELENSAGEIIFVSYDSKSRVTSVHDPLRGMSVFTYDANNKLLTTTNAMGDVTTREYDSGGNLVKTTDTELGETILGYDSMENLVSVEDPNGQLTTFTFDLLNRLTHQENPRNKQVSYDYDRNGNVISITDQKGQVTLKTYDDLSRLIGISTPDNTITISYDPAGNVLSVDDDDSSLLFTYDSINRPVTAETIDVGVQPNVMLTNTWNELSNRTALVDSPGGMTGFAFDDAGRLLAVNTPLAGDVTFTYDAAGRPATILYPNDVLTTLTRDLSGRLTDVDHVGNGGIGPVLQALDYGYNAIGNITSKTDTLEAQAYSYDKLERLLTGGTESSPESYTYDAVGNRTTSHLSSTHILDSAHRLIEDDDYTYTYDDNDNILSKTRKLENALTNYTWDAQDQLVEIEFPDLTTATYRYDALKRRIEKNVNGVITRYIYDGDNILLEYDGSNVQVARYVHGEGPDQPLIMERGGAPYFYHADHQGSVELLSDELSGVVNRYTYDAFGRVISSLEGIPNPYTYTGREGDAESGLMYYRARYYDPDVGKFISRDPVGFSGGDINLFAYVQNNAVNMTDPSGLNAHFLSEAYKFRRAVFWLKNARQAAAIQYSMAQIAGYEFGTVVATEAVCAAPAAASVTTATTATAATGTTAATAGGGAAGGLTLAGAATAAAVGVLIAAVIVSPWAYDAWKAHSGADLAERQAALSQFRLLVFRARCAPCISDPNRRRLARIERLLNQAISNGGELSDDNASFIGQMLRRVSTSAGQ